MAGDAPAAPELQPKMFILPAVMLLVKFLKLDFAEYVDQLRLGFAAACLLTLGTMLTCKSIAASKNDATELEVTSTNLKGEKETKTMTTCAYDQMEALKKVKAGLGSVCMVSLIHWKWGSPMPLLFQCIMQPMNLTDDPLVQIHLLGKAAEGKLARPFKAAPNPLAELLGGDKQDDTAAVARKKKNEKKD